MDLSVIVPVFNEEENLPTLFKSLTNSLVPLQLNFEMIFVDDGSTDKSFAVLNEFLKESPNRMKLIQLRKNYGQTTAISAGINNAFGDVIILLDADMQNDPSDIPLLLEKLREGFDVVSGWRKDRKDKYLTRILPSQIANAIISKITGLKLHDYGCTLKAYRREFLGSFQLYGEMHRFIPVYAQGSGAKITEVVVHHNERLHGKSKYGLDRTMKVILDLITVKFLMSYSGKPMRLFGGVGMGLIIMSTIMLLFLMIRRIFFTISVVESPLFQASLVTLILGVQSIMLGLIAELLTRTYYESQGKSTYSIRSIIKNIEE